MTKTHYVWLETQKLSNLSRVGDARLATMNLLVIILPTVFYSSNAMKIQKYYYFRVKLKILILDVKYCRDNSYLELYICPSDLREVHVNGKLFQKQHHLSCLDEVLGPSLALT